MIQKMVTQAKNIVFFMPVYLGGLSSVAKLIIENHSFPSILANKPAVMVAVAARGIGAIKRRSNHALHSPASAPSFCLSWSA